MQEPGNNPDAPGDFPPPDAASRSGEGRAKMISDAIPPGAKGFAAGYWAQAKEVLLHPQVFFGSMPLEGGMREPLIFLCTTAAVNAVLTGLLGLNMVMILLIFPSALVGTFLGSAVASWLSQMLGGKHSFEAIFRVFAYSAAPMLFNWVPVAGIAMVFYSWVLNYFGLRRATELSEPKTIMVVVLSGILAALILGLAACGMALKAIFKF